MTRAGGVAAVCGRRGPLKGNGAFAKSPLRRVRRQKLRRRKALKKSVTGGVAAAHGRAAAVSARQKAPRVLTAAAETTECGAERVPVAAERIFRRRFSAAAAAADSEALPGKLPLFLQ